MTQVETLDKNTWRQQRFLANASEKRFLHEGILQRGILGTFYARDVAKEPFFGRAHENNAPRKAEPGLLLSKLLPYKSSQGMLEGIPKFTT